MGRVFPLILCFSLLSCSSLLAQNKDAKKDGVPGAFPPDQETMRQIRAKTDQLGKALAALKESGVKDPLLADVEVFHRAAVVIVRNNDFHYQASGDWTLEVLDLGLARAKIVAEGKAPWAEPGKHAIRAYRSRVDGSVQPYAVSLPAGLADDDDKRRPNRIDVILHCRNDLLTEVAFLRTHKDKAAGSSAAVHIEVFGRGNNAYRWAGETDVFEALKAYLDNEPAKFAPRQTRSIVLRGFSMGGAGVWHLGLHHPDRWCVIGPGAGFSNTKGLPAAHPKVWDKCLTIYDAVDYAGNAFNVPIVAYSGGMDAQKAAADNIEVRLKTLGLSDKMTHLIAPEQKHNFPPNYVKKADALWSKFAALGRNRNPKEVQFTTYTLKYPKCDWVTVLGLERHYEEAQVFAKQTDRGFDIKTKNVRRLFVADNPVEPRISTMKIDGDVLMSKPGGFLLEKKDGHWRQLDGESKQAGLEKIQGLQGPIDDAFTDGFLCVQGTNETWHPATAAYFGKDLSRFAFEWSKYMHGDFPIKEDAEVTPEDIAGKNLILFGDPASNRLIARVLDKLPLRWTKETIELAGKKYKTAEHVPVMIFPNPLNPKKYVVLNSGHTFHETQFKQTNAFLFPRLGDVAVLKIGAEGSLDATPVEIGLFDEFWRTPLN